MSLLTKQSVVECFSFIDFSILVLVLMYGDIKPNAVFHGHAFHDDSI